MESDSSINQEQQLQHIYWTCIQLCSYIKWNAIEDVYNFDAIRRFRRANRMYYWSFC